MRLIWLSILMACALVGHAQTDSIKQVIGRFESRNDHQSVINEVQKILAVTGNSLSTPDRIAVKTILVNKYIELQQWDSCINFCQRQITAAHRQGNTLEEASFYKLIGNTYYSIRDKAKAQEYWRKTITIAEVNDHTLLLEQCYHNLAAVAIDSGIHLAEAEQYLLKSLQLARQNQLEGTTLYNQHNRLLATLYERSNQLDKAEALYLDVIAKSRLMNDTMRLAESLMFYSDVLTKRKKFDQAITVSSEAVEIAKRVKMLDLLPTSYFFHAKNLYTAGRYKEAYDFKVEEANVNTLRFNNDLHTKITEAEAKFKNAEVEHEKKLAIIKANKEKQVYTQLLIGILIIAGLAFYAFYQRKSSRQKLQIQQQIQSEKERLSRDLHDNLGSQMALLSNHIETLDTNYKRQNQIEAGMEKVKDSSRQLLQILRETIWVLNKEQVTAQDFFDKLVDYARRYLQSYSGISLAVQENFTHDKTIGTNEALQLFRICQEAITNSCKYSGSSILHLRGSSTENGFTIAISDTGKGFDRTGLATGEHYGLHNMQERALQANITLKLETEYNKGTTVTVSL